MLLRRITKHVKDQNWFAVFVDFVIVVVGILIAFQITELNEKRNERHKEAAYLNQLLEDINSDFSEFKHVTGTAKDRMSAIYLILEKAQLKTPKKQFLLRSCIYEPCTGGNYQFAEIDSFVSESPYAAGEVLINVPQFDPARHTYEALLSTGDIGLIRNKALSRLIQSYYANAIEVRNLYRIITINHDKLVNHMHEVGMSIGGNTTEEIIAFAAADATFAAILRSHYTYSGFQIRAMEHSRMLAEELVVAIKAEVN